ncbi:MAG: hypothetical protein HY914_09345 [Desulfomonile tiedjei]|nr:hypothetical protein [Desulfomonile tiedjei]
MHTLLRVTCLVAILSLVFGATSFAQQSRSATATAVRPPSGGGGTAEIAQNALTFKRAELTRQLREIQRCISDASNPIVLRDPQGNINRVPQTDLINCARKLGQLQRQLSSLQRQSNALAQDATFQSILLQDALQIAQRKVRAGERAR